MGECPMSKRPCIPQTSVDTLQLTERLRAVPIGETIPYSDLTKVIGRDVTGPARGNLMSARRACQRDYSIVFGAVFRVGLKRLDNVGCLSVGEGTVRRIHKQAKRGADVLGCVDYGALDNDGRVKHNTVMAGLGALYAITKTSATKKLEKAVTEAQKALPLAATLEAFKS